MRIDILTLFPEMLAPALDHSIIGRARKKGLLQVCCHQLRDFAQDRGGRVDDTVFGGGKGMLLAAEPLARGIDALAEHLGFLPHILYMSPRGPVLTQEKARRLAQLPGLLLLCGHYEGVDQRLLDEYQAEEISIGDYVLTGGELAACIIADSVVRLVPGAIGDEASALTDCFQDNLLAPPVYTRPAEFRGWRVPDVLLSGNFAQIEKWQDDEAWERTRRLRPDLLEE